MSGTDAASIDPGDQPVELPPDSPSTLILWAALLAGPVIWMTHFMLVYLVAEAACASATTDQMAFLGVDALVASVTAATVVAAAAAAAAGWWSWRWAGDGSGDRAVLGHAGVLLAAGSVLGVLAVGLPVLALDPC